MIVHFVEVGSPDVIVDQCCIEADWVLERDRTIGLSSEGFYDQIFRSLSCMHGCMTHSSYCNTIYFILIGHQFFSINTFYLQPVAQWPGNKHQKIDLSAAWQPNRHLWADCLESVGSSTFHNPIGLHGLLEGYLSSFSFYCTSIFNKFYKNLYIGV
jgi:hypothetical protein